MKPTKEHVNKALKLVNRASDYDYFFDHLMSPDWLEPLVQSNIFDKPEPIYDDGDTIRIPSWPPAKYLRRMASKAPKSVLNIIKNISVTENPKIHLEFIEAALNMPSDISVSLCDEIVEWLDGKYQFLLGEKIAILIHKLFNDGFDKQALMLSKKLFSIEYYENDEGESKRKDSYIRNEWEYNEFIKTASGGIKKASSKFSFVLILCDNLKYLIETEKRIKKTREIYRDHSLYWRITIEENKDFVDDLEDVLINWIRDLGIDIISAEVEKLDQVVNSLLSIKYPIFIRLSLFFIWKNISRADLALKVLLNEDYATMPDVWHEYTVLLRDIFPSLNDEQKTEVLNFIYNLKSSEEEMKDEYRKYRYLYLIRDNLPEDEKSDFVSLKLKYGEKQELPEYLFYSYGVTKIGLKSTITQDELKKMTAGEVSNYLLSWKPPADERYGEYTYGLSQEIEHLISVRSSEFLNNIDFLKLKNCALVRAVIQGFSQSIKEGTDINWDSILEYLLWSVTVSYKETSDANRDLDKEMKWSGVKEAACSFLQKAFSAKNGELPIQYKKTTWNIIAASLNDRNPDERRERDLSKDYHHVAINSTRGIAMETAIRYGLWVMRTENISKEKSSRKYYEELFAILDRHLNLKFEKSKAVRSVYGVWLPWLLLLDRNWAKSKLNIIFPIGDSNRLLKSAAWDAYLLYSQPYNEVFKEIETIYLDSINEIASYEAVDGEKLLNRMIDHIVIFYLRAVIEINSKVITLLYEKIDDETKAHLIDFMGRFTNEDFATRAKDFWDWRIIECGKSNDWSELKEFGWWMQSSGLSKEWILDQAAFVLEKTSTILPSHTVVESLIDLCSDYPEKTLKVFQLIVDKKVSEHGFFLWRSAAESLIPILLESPCRDQTIKMVNKLIAYGMSEFEGFLD